jgi:very-short-patch-repair endonuclease
MDHMIQNIKNGIIKYPIVPQYKLMVGNVEHPVDFALPHVKLIIEADGEIFHSAPKQIQKDQERDMKLNQMGWVVLRFKDNEIEKQPQQVISKIVQTIMKQEMAVKQNAQK